MHDRSGDIVLAGLWFLAGAAVEVLNTVSRKLSVDRLEDAASVGWILVGLFLRLGVTAGILALAFRHAAASGAAALIGYLSCRWVMVWWLHRRLKARTTPPQ
jgi:hypothetical protein